MAFNLAELNSGLFELQKTFEDISQMHNIIIESSNFLISQLTELLSDQPEPHNISDYLKDD